MRSPPARLINLAPQIAFGGIITMTGSLIVGQAQLTGLLFIKTFMLKVVISPTGMLDLLPAAVQRSPNGRSGNAQNMARKA